MMYLVTTVSTFRFRELARVLSHRAAPGNSPGIPLATLIVRIDMEVAMRSQVVPTFRLRFEQVVSGGTIGTSG